MVCDGTTHGPGQLVRDLLAQYGIAGQPDGAELARRLQSRIDCRAGISGVCAEKPHNVARGIPSCDDDVEDVLSVIGDMHVAIAQGTAFQHAELV